MAAASSTLVILPRGDESEVISFQADVCADPLFFLPVQNLYNVLKIKCGLLTVHDELIIYKMSSVMKVGHVQEAARFTVTEVFFTFLVTLSSWGCMHYC